MDMKLLETQYFGMVPLKDFKWQQDENQQEILFTPLDQRLLLKEICEHQLNKTHPPSVNYRKTFLKYVISQAEKHGQDVEDELYDSFTRLMSLPQSLHEDYCFKSYSLGGAYVTLKESVNLISHGTTGLTTWQASFYFIEWALASQAATEFTKKTILELGCGLGFTGISLCRQFELCEYIFTDCHADVLEKLRENIKINLKNVSCKWSVLCLDWSEERGMREAMSSLSGGQLDYVIATGKHGLLGIHGSTQYSCHGSYYHLLRIL